MLVKLYPEQVEAGWDLFAPMVQKAVPPELGISGKALVQVLKAILAERATAWVEVSDEGAPRAFAVTTVDMEPIMNTKRLLIYILHVFGKGVDREAWQAGIGTLEDHARSKGCQEVIMYVTDSSFERYLNQLGIDTGTSLMRINL